MPRRDTGRDVIEFIWFEDPEVMTRLVDRGLDSSLVLVYIIDKKTHPCVDHHVLAGPNSPSMHYYVM